jgi:hypothetical protein
MFGLLSSDSSSIVADVDVDVALLMGCEAATVLAEKEAIRIACCCWAGRLLYL